MFNEHFVNTFSCFVNISRVMQCQYLIIILHFNYGNFNTFIFAQTHQTHTEDNALTKTNTKHFHFKNVMLKRIMTVLTSLTVLYD